MMRSQMKCLDLTFPSPAENLACDEALLDLCEAGDELEILRFWEPQEHFIVLGYSNRVASEVDAAACDAAGIPIFRRCSGGGTVVQGAGCLNYSLILPIEPSGALATVTETNTLVMQRNRQALQRISSAPVEIRGCTDLAVQDVKFSGNAQRRRRRSLLFHGTFLLRFDLSLIERLLPLPSHQPEYRQARSHRDFLRNLEVSAQSVREALRAAWEATAPLEHVPHAAMQRLVAERYSTRAWNLKF